MKTTISTKQSEVNKKWILIDASNLVVGRLAAFVANRLRGKHLPSYTPHVDDGDNVIIINADKVHFTGSKLSDKIYYKHRFQKASKLLKIYILLSLPINYLINKVYYPSIVDLDKFSKKLCGKFRKNFCCT